ncbi:unnamed protein product, partial [Ectocarpus sp. 4 AP-2014]
LFPSSSLFPKLCDCLAMAQWQDPYNVVGFVGGVVLASSLLPQIYLAHKRRSTADISYLWQAVYILGLIHLLIFYAHFNL